MMNFLKVKQCFIVISFWLMSELVVAGDFAIIVHPSNDSQFDTALVERLFLIKQKSFPNGGKATPINSLPESTLYKSFFAKFMSKTESQLRSYYARLMFSGEGTPPQIMESPEEILKLVETSPDAIGYVPKNLVTSKVRVAMEF